MPTPSNWDITATRPVLFVSDIDRAIEWYAQIGFKEVFRNDRVYAVLQIGAHFIHLGTKMDPLEVGHAQAVMELRGVDAYYAYCTSQGATIHRGLEDRFYGMRDFQVRDPDGNLITFGEHRKTGQQ